MTANELTNAGRADAGPTNERRAPVGDVVVGLDGSDHALRALSWATANTAGPISLVVTWRTPWWGVPAPLSVVPAPAPPPDAYFEASSKQIIEDARPLLDGHLTVPASIRRGHAGQSLVEVANERGRLLVVGSRGRGAVASALLGSTSSYCAAKSEVPVVIVPEGDVAVSRRIVVGVDGSANSDAALLWAIDNSSDDAVIVALGAWAPPMSYDGALLVQIDDLEEQNERLVHEAVGRARSSRPGLDRSFEVDVQMGDPRRVIRAAGGDRIVIGARGHRGLEYLMMGSTASALTHQPLVPTVIVPTPTVPTN